MRTRPVTARSRDRGVAGSSAATAPDRRRDIAWLQRTAGNQATVRLLQRTPVAPADYFKGIVAKSAADPEWDPKWTRALNGIAARDDLAVHFGATIDDASESDAARVIRVLTGLKVLSYEKPNPYIAAIDAVRWHFGIESNSGGSGFGSLDTSGKEFEGRPAFPAITQATITLKAGQHRRHILAWHDIREFMQLAYGVHRDTVITTIAQVADRPGPGADMAFADAWEHVMKGREKTHNTAPTLSDPEWLKIALFVMNGNPRNLWPGKGRINSALNTAQMAMNEKLAAVTTFAGLGQLAEEWMAGKGKEVYKTATRAAAEMLMQEGTKVYSLWEYQGRRPDQEQPLVKDVVSRVSRHIVSNLEIDVFGDNKEQNEHIQALSKQLLEPRMIIDNVVRNPGLIAAVEPRFIAFAIREFLSYAPT